MEENLNLERVKFEDKFPIKFEYEGLSFNMKITPFGNRPDEKWIKITINREDQRSRLFRSPQIIDTEVGDLTLKFIGDPEDETPTLYIMGNYKTGVSENQVRGVVGFAIQEFVEQTGLALEVSGLSSQGARLYERILENHRDSINIQKTGVDSYRLTRNS